MSDSTKRAQACMHHTQGWLCLEETSAGRLLLAGVGRLYVCLHEEACASLLPRVHHLTSWAPVV